MKKAFSIVLIAVVCIIGIFALMNYKNANDTKENSEVDIYKTSEYKTSQLQSIPKRQKIDIFLLCFET